MKKINFKLIVLFTILIIVNISSCKMAIQSLLGKKNAEGETSSIQLDQLSWNKSSIDLKIGGMDHILLTAKPESKRNEATIVYEYNSDIINLITDSRGVIVEGLKKGKTTLSAINGKIRTNCIINVSGYDENYEKEPYIYSVNNIIQLRPGTQERVAVSLYGGSAEDSQKFIWKNEKNEVVEIAPNGQFCLINAKGEGNSKITITHPKAAYPYSILVYNLADTQKATYISTTDNVITLQKNKGEKEIKVVMENAPNNFNPALFKWELVQNEGEVCSIDFNREKCVISPLSAGTAIIKISHHAAPYPLEILVRVVELVKNVYIKPSDTFVEISGDETKTLSLQLEGTSENYDVNEFQWDVPENEVITYNHYGNEILLSGKKNGMVKITVSHPMAAYPRDIMVNVKNQTSDAVDSSNYVTTSQNYIRTKIGAEAIPLNILLVGGEVGDQKKFKWTIKNTPKIAGQKVINFETTHGEVFSRSLISTSYEDGTGYITPLSEGTAVIEITHPKILYSTEVLVKVLPASAILEEPFYFTGIPIVKLLNGKEQEVNINLHGKTKTDSDNSNIIWNTESPHIIVTGNGEKAVIRATGHGSNISHITISHPRADVDKKIVVLTADTQEELDKMKSLYAYKHSYKTKVDDTLVIQAEQTGFTEEEITNFTWTVLTPNLLNCEPYIDEASGKTLHMLTKIKGLKSGEGKIILKSNLPGIADLSFDITILPKNANIEAEPDEAYLTTFQNVVSLKEKNESANVEVSAIGLSSNKLSGISWAPEKNGIVSINSQGSSAVFTALKEGETKVFVSHPECQNKLTIHVKVGKEYIFNNNDKTIYISTDIDTILAIKDEPAKKITARLINYSDFTNEKFKFEIDKPDIASISQGDNACLIKPIKAGQALITVSHPKSNFTKSVLVVVGNSKEELEGFSYLTTANNVITVTKGQSKNISVAVMNSPDIIIDGYSWESKNPEIATAQGVGASAVIHGNEVGTARIVVSNTKCTYPLKLIVICVDSSQAALNPFISASPNVLNLKAEQGPSPWTTFTATLEGGSDFDQQNFSWQIEDSSIVQMFGQGATCKMRALKAGTTRLIITHPKAEYSCYVLLICDAVKPNKCYISVPEKIISMKPNQSEMAITASLTNGDIEDKYAFNFYADTYDVIELNYSANVASIRPIGQGQTTIHVTHPKAAYEQQIIVKVSEYTQFEFAMDYYKLTKGKTGYVSMRVPVTSVPCHVEYESLNTNICMIEGTNKTAQITGLAPGNTKVKAKLVATKTNIVQATAEMLINIEESTEDLIYITTTKTVYSIEKGTTTTITANITGQGIGTVDQQNLKWKSSDPSVIKLVGASTTGIATGPQCMLQALKAGECTVTISHDKCNTDLIIKIIVPGTDDVDISLNKTYIRLETGGRTEVKAKLTNAKPEDYKTIEWSIEKQNGNVIADVLGKGETVAAFARNVGKTVLHARLPNGKSTECEIVVEASRHITFASQEMFVEPGQTKTIKYTVAPEDAGITWTTDSDTYFNYSVDEHTKTVIITGKTEGFGRLTGVTQYGNRTTLAVKCSWNYHFSINKSIIKSEPDFDSTQPDKFIIKYKVIPSDAEIEVNFDNDNIADFNIDKLRHEIIITPKKEGEANILIKALNIRDSNHEIGVRQCKLIFKYDKITFKTKILSKIGKFSNIKDNKIILGDGEKINLKFEPNYPKIEYEISNLEWEPAAAYLTDVEIKNKIIISQDEDMGKNERKLEHTQDFKDYSYKFTHKPYISLKNKKIYFKWKDFDTTKLNFLDIPENLSQIIGEDIEPNQISYTKEPYEEALLVLQEEKPNPDWSNGDKRYYAKEKKKIVTVKCQGNSSKHSIKNIGFSKIDNYSPYKLHINYSDAVTKVYASVPYKETITWDNIIYGKHVKRSEFGWWGKYNDVLETDKTVSKSPITPKVKFEPLATPVYASKDEVELNGVIKTKTKKKTEYFYPLNNELLNFCTPKIQIKEDSGEKITINPVNFGFLVDDEEERYNKPITSLDESVKKELFAGFIKVTFIRSFINQPSKQEFIKIPVYFERRDCNINCSEEIFNN